jgi:potassium efflux system protein
MRLHQSPGFLLATLLYLLIAITPPLAAAGKPWDADPIDPKALDAVLAATGKDLKALPSGKQATAHSTSLHAIMERRQGLLQDLIAALKAQQAIVAQAAEIQSGNQDQKLSKPPGKVPAASSQAPPKPPSADEVSPEGLEELKHVVEQAHTRIGELSSAVRKNRERANHLPDLIDQTRTQHAKARATLDELAAENAAAGDSLDLLVLQQENAAIAARTAAIQIKTLDLEQDTLRKQAPTLLARLDKEKEKLAPLEEAFNRYKDVLQQRQTAQTEALARQAKQKEQEAKAAGSPVAKFLAEAEARVATIEHDNATIAGFRTQLANEILALENGLKSDQDDLRELQGMIATVGVSGPATEMLREIYGDIEIRRRRLQESVSPKTSDWVDGISAHTIAAQRQLAGLNKQWQQQIAELPADKTQGDAFRKPADAVLKATREALFKQSELLRLAAREGHKLQSLPIQRITLLDQLEEFVTRNVLWMQDARPLDGEVLANARAEAFSKARPNSLVNWLARQRVSQVLADSSQVLGYSNQHLLGLLLILVLPTLLWWFNRGNYAPGTSVFRNLFGTTVFPAYLIAIALVIRPAESQVYNVLWTSRILVTFAIILQLWLLSRVFFSAQGIAMRRFNMPADVARSLRLTLHAWVLGAVLLLLPAHILADSPFEFSGLPRLLYTTMEILVVISLFLLLRSRSPLMRALFGEGSRFETLGSVQQQQTHRFLAHHWNTINAAISAFLIGIVVLDVLGFRYTAQRLSLSAIATLVIVAAMLAIYWIVVATMDRFMWQRLHTAADAPSADSESDPQRLERQVKKGLRTLLTLGSVLLIVAAWTSPDGNTLPLQRFKLYAVVANDGSREFVTLLDMLDFVMVMVLLLWLLRELKTLFELLIFPHLKLDRGKRYALVTISRYALFTIGVIIALGILRVNLGQLGWLVAAMGVGLGFGLQEIFANFISGLILLVERPIRVGDLVTIGNVMGNVSHISFRATTLVAFDNEEIIVPNQELITGQVTNWTLGNQITRITIPKQAAYGSDGEQSTEILLAIAKDDPEVLSDPAPGALFMNHGDSGLDFELRVFLGSAGVRLSTRDRLNRKVNAAFVKHDIEIPYPQRDIHIRSVDWPDAPTTVPPPSTAVPPTTAAATSAPPETNPATTPMTTSETPKL